jgi:hypothetical protein
MLKSFAVGACLLVLAACAGAPSKPDQATAANVKPPAGCVGQTATLIPLKDPRSCAGFGSSYTRDDLDRTGQIDLGPALRMLDPSISTTGR